MIAPIRPPAARALARRPHAGAQADVDELGALVSRRASSESLIAAGYEHRQAGLADTYAVLASPVVNQVGYLEPAAR